MIVMCLDPSLRNTGVSVLETSGSQNIPKNIIYTETVKTYKGDYQSVIGCMKSLLLLKKEYDPALCVAEIPHGSQSNSGAISLGFSLAIAGMLEAFPVSPKDISNVIGFKKGEDKKRKAIEFVSRNLFKPAMFWNTEEMNHIADSICAYYAYLSISQANCPRFK